MAFHPPTARSDRPDAIDYDNLIFVPLQAQGSRRLIAQARGGVPPRAIRIAPKTPVEACRCVNQ